MASTRACLRDLARYRVGTEVYLVGFIRQEPELQSDDLWMQDDAVHPQVLWKRKLLRCDWLGSRQLPKLHAGDFEPLLELMSASLEIVPFNVDDVCRCPHTGEMLYCDNLSGWVPESCLFQSKQTAIRERCRIVGLLRDWVKHLG